MDFEKSQTDSGGCRIKVLPEALANQIAAGEVVERPASVLKELVENSLDSGATRVTVAIEQGGLGLIRVQDNGCGMTPQEASLALARHATSKLSAIEDLARLETLGFRGEALPSIASVSRFSILTRPQDLAVGCRVDSSGGGQVAMKQAGCAPGTVVEVKDLFFNVPARRKFLRRPETEAGHAQEAMLRLSLTHPDVHMSLESDGRSILDLERHDSLTSRIEAALEKRAKGRLYRTELRHGDLLVEVFLASPESSVSTARFCFSYVNGRYVRDRILLRALLDGYGPAMASRRYPVAVLLLELPLHLVDVNVHPQKHEVRFSNEREVAAAVRRSTAELAAKAPWSITASTRYVLHDPSPVDDAGNAGRPSLTAAREPALTYPHFNRDSRAPENHRWPRTEGQPAHPSMVIPPASRWASELWKDTMAVPSTDQRPPSSQDAVMFGGEGLSKLRYVGQVMGTYLLFEDASGMVIMDQHAASERVMYNRILDSLESGPLPAQRLLLPVQMELTPSEASVLDEARSELARLGFEIEPLGPKTHLLRAVPVQVVEAGADPEKVARDVLYGLLEAVPTRSSGMDTLLDELASRMACHTAVRAGQVLSEAEVNALVVQMGEAPFRDRCPHGRPVLIRVDRVELERRFKRS